MVHALSNDQVRFLRLRAQRLIPQPEDNITSVAGVVKDLCGIQAQDARAAALAVRVRSAGLVVGDVEQAMGTWKIKWQKNSMDVVLKPFEALASDIKPGLEAEVQDIARFLGMPARLQVMVP